MNKTFHLSVVLLIGIGLAALLCLALPASASTEVPSQTGIVVDTLEDELNGDGDCSLREAITAANDNTPTDACPGGDGVLTDTITFNVAGTITQTEQIVVTAGGPLVIDCGNAITISGNGINNPVGTLVVKGCTISRTGRGISNEGSLVLVNSVISDNIAILWAGGLSNNGIAEIRDSTISGNIAYTPHMWCAIGGGIVNRGTMTVTNSTLSENVAIGYYGCSSSGGGIHNTGTLRIINSTLSGNGADHGGGIDNRYLGMTTATNTIIANSTWGGGDCGGTIIDGGHNISSDDTCGFDPANGSMPNTNPLLGPLQDNGGPTLTHALLPGSPAIDAGDDAQCPPTDQRGVPRPLDGDGDGVAVCDIGSYEFEPGQLVVTTLNDIVDSDDGYCSLREAIDAASTNSYVEDCGTGDVLTDTITFDVSGMITVTSQLWVTPGGPLVIDGGGGIIISGGSNVRIFTIYYGLVITLNGLTISNGHQYAGGGIANFGFLTIINSTLLDNYAVDFGGGIENHGTLTMVNSTLSGNSSHTGGAIYNYSGTVTITNSTLTGNSANSGGGIWNGGALTIANSTLSGNNANSGGGIFNGGPLTITDSTLSGNSAINDGGGITNWSTLLTIANTTLSGNTGWDGGGIYNSEGTLTITNSTLSGNSANNDGGGIRNNGTLTITNSTLSGNNATNSGGGIYNLSWGPLTIANSIIANSLSGVNCAGDPITDAGHNIEDTDTCGFDPANGSMPDTDPLLGPLQDNGGPTLTHALLPGSPAIDAGDDDQCPTVDQRGYQRPIDGDGDGTAVCDIGSFEVQAATIPPDLITISGKEDGIVGPVVYFTATVEPISTSLPLTYTWHASDHPPITETRGLTDTVGWAWEIPGTYAITVTASNLAGSVMDTHLITITAMAPVMPESVTIIAPEEGLIGYPYDFIASVDPVSTSLPLNYTWQASGQAPVTHTSGITDQVSFTWEIPGTQLITVTASNDFNAVVDTHAILIEPIPEPLHKIYLPLINRSRQAATSSTSYLPGGGALVLLLIVGAISRWRKRI